MSGLGLSSPMRIALIGREAADYVDKFRHTDCRIIAAASEITSDDDLVFCLSHPKLIPVEIVDRPRHGVWVNHSSDLPEGRGFAPLQWSVLKGLRNVTVTIFKATADCDAGPWAYKIRFPIEPHDTIETLRCKDIAASVEGFRRLIAAIASGTLVLHEQIGAPTHWPRRTPWDSELDANKPLLELWDQIRVCDNSNNPAWFRINGRRVTLRYHVAD